MMIGFLFLNKISLECTFIYPALMYNFKIGFYIYVPNVYDFLHFI